jgi:hypothetical protein
MIWIRTKKWRIREAKKHTDPDPPHWLKDWCKCSFSRLLGKQTRGKNTYFCSEKSPKKSAESKAVSAILWYGSLSKCHGYSTLLLWIIFSFYYHPWTIEEHMLKLITCLASCLTNADVEKRHNFWQANMLALCISKKEEAKNYTQILEISLFNNN